ncbi:unnamed protein product, partial [Arabidopsis halleri]
GRGNETIQREERTRKWGEENSRVGNALAKRCGTQEYCVAFVCGLKATIVGIFVR